LTRQTALGVGPWRYIDEKNLKQYVSQCLINQQDSPLIEEEYLSELPEPPLTALITMLMLRFMQLKSQWGWSLSNLVALLRMNLFTHRDLWPWLNDPLGVPPDPAAPNQIGMAF
jgi:hypothetical protein